MPEEIDRIEKVWEEFQELTQDTFVLVQLLRALRLRRRDLPKETKYITPKIGAALFKLYLVKRLKEDWDDRDWIALKKKVQKERGLKKEIKF
jgi:hypothetical protein